MLEVGAKLWSRKLVDGCGNYLEKVDTRRQNKFLVAPANLVGNRPNKPRDIIFSISTGLPNELLELPVEKQVKGLELGRRSGRQDMHLVLQLFDQIHLETFFVAGPAIG